MKNCLLAFLCLLSYTLLAHNNHEHANLKQWSITTENKTLEASFLMMKDKVVYLEDAQQQIQKLPLSALSLNDQLYVIQRYKQIEKLNTPSVPNAFGMSLNAISSSKNAFDWQAMMQANFWLLAWFFSLLTTFLFIRLGLKKYAFRYTRKYAYPLALVGFMAIFISFMPKPILGTDPLFVDSAFVPFKSKVKTRWDATYFYVESLGLPTHPMMKGITNWQQQVPTPKCYTGVNAWSIPLNPVVAATPTPTKTNFFKGAIAIAANGIPIFNALNNRGEDSYLIGELDLYGGHCGKGDDYHYHVAPLSLDSINAAILPIAFALDGYAVYAAKEPSGVAMTALDANHGHYLNGVYHYHGTVDYPYMVGNMVGVVTKDATDQIVPQPTGNPFRPAGNPLNGAAITGCVANGTNGFNLSYTLANQTYSINYSWTAAGAFTFNFVSPTATTTSNYTGMICTLATATDELFANDNAFKIYPNPAKNGFSLDLSSPYNVNDVKSVSIFDVKGSLLYETKGYKSFIDLPHFTEGVYFMKVQFSASQLTKKLVVQ
jgi:hypothetical protein